MIESPNDVLFWLVFTLLSGMLFGYSFARLRMLMKESHELDEKIDMLRHLMATTSVVVLLLEMLEEEGVPDEEVEGRIEERLEKMQEQMDEDRELLKTDPIAHREVMKDRDWSDVFD